MTETQSPNGGNETCQTYLDDAQTKTCGQPVTDVIRWADVSRPEYPEATSTNHGGQFEIGEDGMVRYLAFYPHMIERLACSKCADMIMQMDTQLEPIRTPIV